MLTIGRIEIAAEVEMDLQRLLDLYQTGLDVATVTLQDVNPPEAVKAAFNAVNEAKQEKERLINEAWRDYNQSVPKSKGVGSATDFGGTRLRTQTGERGRKAMLIGSRQFVRSIRKRKRSHADASIWKRCERFYRRSKRFMSLMVTPIHLSQSCS